MKTSSSSERRASGSKELATSNEQKQATTMAMDATKGATVRIFWFGFGRPET